MIERYSLEGFSSSKLAMDFLIKAARLPGVAHSRQLVSLV